MDTGTSWKCKMSYLHSSASGSFNNKVSGVPSYHDVAYTHSWYNCLKFSFKGYSDVNNANYGPLDKDKSVLKS